MPSCALCKADGPIVQSHILPAFVFRWMKETGATGYIRGSESPNRRKQDGLKIPLLCIECEKLFNEFETPFATHVFHPIEANAVLKAPYGPWMLKFCVSVSWRVLTCFLHDHADEAAPPETRADMSAALERWSGFLTGKYPHPDRFEQHFMRLSPITQHIEPNMPNSMNRYLMRASDIYLVEGPGALMTYAKFGAFALFGYIRMDSDPWVGTKVHVRQGAVTPTGYRVPKKLLRFFMHRADSARQMLDDMSLRQVQQSDSALGQNIERFSKSAQLRAMLYDQHLFGMDALIRKK
jgi:hypothetical protein